MLLKIMYISNTG